MWFVAPVALYEKWYYYLFGQILGGIFFTQSFILMHEMGHNSFFKTKKLNEFLGYIFSILVFSPFTSWREIHDLHHKWTGRRDKDPTTEKTFVERLSSTQKMIINISWKYYIPLFTVGYRFGTYWKSEKLKRHLTDKVYKRCLLEICIYSGFYLLTLLFFFDIYILIFPALYLSFMFTDIITLSQHSYIEMPLGSNEGLSPLNFKDQVVYSRSLELPPLIGEFAVFNFNFHEYHHIYPGLPCYHLAKVSIKTVNSYPLVPWIRKVKALKGVDFIFKTMPAEKREL